MAGPIGIITGSGTYALPGFDGEAEPVRTPWGEALVSRGTFAGVDVAHVSRHGAGHVRLSNHVEHRANIAALRSRGVAGAIAVTVCGAVDPGVELGSLVCFDDLHFPVNRLPDGSLCTFFAEPGDPARGHWIYEEPYSPALRGALLDAAERRGLPIRDGGCYGYVDGPRFNTRAEIRGLAAVGVTAVSQTAGPEAVLAGAAEAGVPIRDGGCYGHVDGPRFNSKAEIRGLVQAGVTAVSQTAGPETVLAGEAELPFALIGYATDYANGVQPEPTPVERLVELIAASTDSFARVLTATVPRVEEAALAPAGVVYRFHRSG